MFKIHQYENLHIFLWLLKDTCWMLQWRVFGTIMIIPTIVVAVIIVIKSWREKADAFWLNIAILFWITGNAYWMLCEFLHHEEIKDYAGFPFVAGLICVVYFYKLRLFRTNSDENVSRSLD